ncbi:carbohydrate-binding protein [Pedobacter hiemivivus]|uniref:alpha-L-fucosidase n=1 Tax=Pedobacter hiemivivus TaxID=2530454 RepID=A0A4U1G0B9_9SPHI|nr:alpha-L-fucosidase [Pedobacter hiemivivus]TKC56915.1 carbohydrate-binding protein [Pedobacter hiemivivus]
MKCKLLVVAAFLCAFGCAASINSAFAQSRTDQRPLQQLQQAFVDLGFGMFIHYNIPTYMNDDWADPDASPEIFNPKKLNTDQWAKAAKSANMSYGCLTTKHHSGFAIWDTKTTDYNVMNSPLKRDVVKEYVTSFRKAGLKVMLYYSILDTHHKLRPGQISPVHIKMVKEQLTELLTNYGEISALVIDGWDAPWSRISYDDVPFEEIYNLIKSIQPNCLVMDLNAAKYPTEALFYTDIKSYEQGAGQHISKEHNKLPALACLPLQENWFWKTSFPTTAVKSPEKMINENAVPYNQVYCNFILNVAPNRDGLIDDNALVALREMGKLYKPIGGFPKFPAAEAPVISSNLAKRKPANGSWSWDMSIMDFAVDDDFSSNWTSHPTVKNPWFEVDLIKETAFNAIVITQAKSDQVSYTIEYFANSSWHPLAEGKSKSRILIHRFGRIWGNKVRIKYLSFDSVPSIAEFGVFNERR